MESSQLLCGVSCNLDTQILQTNLPLFEAEKIEAIEWSFDSLYKTRNIPDWFVELLQTFGKEGRLVGHGIYFSMFSGKWSQEQQQWLDHLKKVSRNFKFDHITEHFGFMTGEDFHKGAPISVPYTSSTLAIGRDRLKRIQNACECPVGLENLAFSYSVDEVKRHGEFLDELIEPVNGFIILDLHNLYCQLHNFSLEFDLVLNAYPLDRVREIHISGGSWEKSEAKPTKTIRRDTHDDSVPTEVFELLKKTIEHCPNLKFVVLEQLGKALHDTKSQLQFRNDFETIVKIVNTFQQYPRPESDNNFKPMHSVDISGVIPEDPALYQQQMELSHILENAKNCENAYHMILQSSLANSAWQPETWAPHMVETAVKIAQKWKSGW